MTLNLNQFVRKHGDCHARQAFLKALKIAQRVISNGKLIADFCRRSRKVTNVDACGYEVYISENGGDLYYAPH